MEWLRQALFLYCLHEPFVFFYTDAFLCSRAPLNAGRLHITGYLLAAVLTLRFRLICPDLVFGITPETDNILRRRGPYL